MTEHALELLCNYSYIIGLGSVRVLGLQRSLPPSSTFSATRIQMQPRTLELPMPSNTSGTIYAKGQLPTLDKRRLLFMFANPGQTVLV